LRELHKEEFGNGELATETIEEGNVLLNTGATLPPKSNNCIGSNLGGDRGAVPWSPLLHIGLMCCDACGDDDQENQQHL